MTVAALITERTTLEQTRTQVRTHRRQSSCFLYSRIALTGRFRTRLIVSRILLVIAGLSAVRFQRDTMSSWLRTEQTAPHISSPTKNCSPIIARTRFSQILEDNPFFNLRIHFPPFRLAVSSQTGLIPSLNRWKSTFSPISESSIYENRENEGGQT